MVSRRRKLGRRRTDRQPVVFHTVRVSLLRSHRSWGWMARRTPDGIPDAPERGFGRRDQAAARFHDGLTRRPRGTPAGHQPPQPDVFVRCDPNPLAQEMDCRIHGTAEACGESGIVSTLVDTLQSSGAIVSDYDTDARRLTDLESPTFYACLLPALQRRHPDVAATVRRTQLSLPQLAAVLDKTDRYYDANWLWFGIALAEGLDPGPDATGRRAAVAARSPFAATVWAAASRRRPRDHRRPSRCARSRPRRPAA